MLVLKIKKEDLVKGVAQTSAIAEKRSSIPILSNILLDADGSELKLAATDMEISFQGSYPAEVTESGRLTVPAKKLNELVRQLNTDEVSLVENANFTLGLTAGQFNTQMYGLSPTDFPQLPLVDNGQYIEVDGSELVGAIDKTIFSVAHEEQRYNLAGIYLEKVEYEGRLGLRLVSTDGHRLNLTTLYPCNLINLELTKGVLVSKKGLSELKRLAESSEILQFGLVGGSLVARNKKSVLIMRLLDGRFPDYNLVLPKDNHKHLLAIRKDLLEALKRIVIMSSDEYKTVKFALAPGQLTISSMTPDLGQAQERLEVEYADEPLESGFNPRFFIEALNALVSEKVKLSFSLPSSPALITAAEDPGYSGVIMSMKI